MVEGDFAAEEIRQQFAEDIGQPLDGDLGTLEQLCQRSTEVRREVRILRFHLRQHLARRLGPLQHLRQRLHAFLLGDMGQPG